MEMILAHVSFLVFKQKHNKFWGYKDDFLSFFFFFLFRLVVHFFSFVYFCSSFIVLTKSTLVTHPISKLER